MSCTFAANSVRVRVGENRNCIIASDSAFRCRGATRNPLSSHKRFHPAHRPREIRVIVDIAERAECEVRLRTGEVVELASGRGREHPDGIAAVEREHLSTLIPEPLRRNQAQQC